MSERAQHDERDGFAGERIEVGMCPACGAWLPWATIVALGGVDHRHNAQIVQFEKRTAVLDGCS